MEMTVPTLSIVLALLSFYYASGQDQVCSNGDLWLTSAGNTTRTACTFEQPTELQLCINERWCSVCAENWNGRLSRTTCRQLGYSKGYRLPVGNSSEEEQVAAAARLDCFEREDISECTISRNSSCPPCNIIHLKCINGETPTRQECNEGDLRLTDSEKTNKGNLEICQLDMWGSVCNTEWSEANSNVACKELGFTAGTDTENKASLRVIDECKSPVHLYNVTCSGMEDNLMNCPHNKTAPSFSYNNNTCGIFLKCSVPKVACKDGDVELFTLDPNKPGQGWLLICFNEEWRTLCDSEWDFLDSTVACRQLGHIGGFHIELPLPGTPKDVYPIHADNVRCMGNETRLLDCQYSTKHNCIHSRDVFLSCRESGDGCSNGDIRLVDGPSDREGRLEFCWNDIWGTVCNVDWIRRNTNVTCQQLGLYTGYEESDLIQPADELPVLIEQTNCSGSEQKLADCAFQFSPAYNCLLHEFDVVLTCLGKEELSDCEDGELNVVGGRNSGEGLLKICHQKVWGTICGNNWDVNTDSVVACRQLGFNRSVPPQFTVGEGKGPIHFTDFMCNGTERSIIECSFQPVELYSSMCDHSRDIHLACQDPIYRPSASTLVVAYALIPVVLFLAGSVAIVSVVVLYLKCRSKDQDQQPRQDSSLLQHTRPADLDGQLYGNAVYSGNLPTPTSLTAMFPERHYMMSESVMGHIYESIGDDDLVSVRYKGDYRRYSLTEKEEGSSGTDSTDPSAYDKLEENCELSPYNVLNRRERNTQDGPIASRYEMQELQINQEDTGYNKLQRRKHEAKQLMDQENYEQIDFPEDLGNN